MLRASVVIDYQNVHMTAHDVFDPRGELHESLIHPVQFAARAIVERNARQRDGMEHARLTRTIGRPKEKGIDVLCALALVREAVRPDVDVVILASRDTDLVPALDEVYDFRGREPQRYAKVETVAWFNRRFREEDTVSGGGLRPTAPRRIWNTNLDRGCFEASIDRTDYRRA